jgi:4-hydroxybenzoate polyprenyltransferase
LLMLLPGALIAAGYVLPILPGRKRLRDLGWGKILLIGWSWGWLTAFVPFAYYADASLFIAGIHTAERMLFIILITIPFEIRDMHIDQSVGLITMPALFGKKRTFRFAVIICFMIFILSFLVSFHYLNPAYFFSMLIVCLMTVPLINQSYLIRDDYFFSGWVDGLMIVALYIFILFNSFL